MARYMNVLRVHKVTDSIAIAASGELSDFQYIADTLDAKVRASDIEGDGFAYTAPELWNYLRRVLYERRNKGDPLWNTVLVAGVGKDSGNSGGNGNGNGAFLGQLDMYGTAIECDYAASGFGLYFAVPLMREEWKEGMTKEEAVALIKKCLEVLLYRDARTINRFRIATITRDGGVDISEPFEIDTAGKWNSGELAINDPK